MSIAKVKEYLNGFSMADRVVELPQSSATVALAAQAIGTEEARIAKTISFWVDDAPVLIVAAGDTKIDNPKFKARFHQKARMIARDEVESAVGHAVGGVCPFAVKDGVQVFLDESLKRFDVVYPACGSANSMIPLTIGELEQVSQASGWVDVCKLCQTDNGCL